MTTATTAASTVCINGETIVVTAQFTLESNGLRPAAATRPLVCKQNTFLFAFGTKTAIDGIELLFFLFEIIDVNHHRTNKYNKQEKQQINIDRKSLGRGIGFKYCLVITVIWHMCFYKSPKSFLMMFIPDMCQFMYDDIFNHFRR